MAESNDLLPRQTSRQRRSNAFCFHHQLNSRFIRLAQEATASPAL